MRRGRAVECGDRRAGQATEPDTGQNTGQNTGQDTGQNTGRPLSRIMTGSAR